MKTQTLFLFVIAFIFSLKGYSQACGEGIVTLNIYTINGQKIKDVSYEIFQASKGLIERHKDFNSYDNGKIITDLSENDTLPTDSPNGRLNKLLERSLISRSGKLTNNIKFKTKELGYFPIILKVSIKNQTMYILGNFFGGCNREACLIWNGKYMRFI
jgi:hypothetical protein